jgi:hypothetical protein
MERTVKVVISFDLMSEGEVMTIEYDDDRMQSLIDSGYLIPLDDFMLNEDESNFDDEDDIDVESGD